MIFAPNASVSAAPTKPPIIDSLKVHKTPSIKTKVEASAGTSPTPVGILPPEKLADWGIPTGVVSYRLVDPNNKTETSIDGKGRKALTSRWNMGPVSV